MNQTIEEFFHSFQQELLAGAEANYNFRLSEFMEVIANELQELGFCEGFELCHFRAQRGMRVDGYWFDDEGKLILFIADFESRNALETLTRTQVDSIFKRITSFVEACVEKSLSESLEITSPEYGLARQINERIGSLYKIELVLFSERALSGRIQEIADSTLCGVKVTHQIWDVSRLFRVRSSQQTKEPLCIDFEKSFGQGIPCLPAHLSNDTYQSYLLVMPATILADLYEEYDTRLLEQNVRTFLQARGNVNKGIRLSILEEPEMFFAYNNGITATAESVQVKNTTSGQLITHLTDFQIVNGGQTTASLFHTRKKDRADLSQIFVQTKLSVISESDSESIVPKISEYANTQNKVNAADFFSNHPFHIRLEEFSRRLWAPVKEGMQRETKWYYERARGQYADAQSKLTTAQIKKFKAENPKPQMFTKTDLAKFENVWDEHPKWVNLGAQKNFTQFAKRLAIAWKKSPEYFNELYFKRLIARAIIFRATEKIVSNQPWYNGGYRANIVAYTLAILSEITKREKKSIDYFSVWQSQKINDSFGRVLATLAEQIHREISSPPLGISNISEWCKKELCWQRILDKYQLFRQSLPSGFSECLVSIEESEDAFKSAKKTQKVDDGIQAQVEVLNTDRKIWQSVLDELQKAEEISPKECSIINIAMQIPAKIPSEQQSIILMSLLNRAKCFRGF